MNEQHIKMAAKLYKCRDAAKSLYGDGYKDRLKVYTNVIQGHMKKFNLDVLPSVIEICNFKSVRDDGTAQMLFLAAAIELIEPSV